MAIIFRNDLYTTSTPTVLKRQASARQNLAEHQVSKLDYFQLKGQISPLFYNPHGYTIESSLGVSFFVIGDYPVEKVTPDLPEFVYRGLSEFFTYDTDDDGFDELYFAVTTLRDLGPLNGFVQIPKTDYYAIDLANQ